MLQSIITMLAVINPFISGVILNEITGNIDRKLKLKYAVKGSLQILGILVAVAFLGKRILETFGISTDTFKIVGGIIIAYIGFTMLNGTIGKINKKSKGKKIDLSPLVMFSASPGTIATLITISVSYNEGAIPTTALIATLVSMVITFLFIVLMIYFPRKEGSELHKVTTRFMGLILIAMGLQFVLEGYKAFMGM